QHLWQRGGRPHLKEGRVERAQESVAGSSSGRPGLGPSLHPQSCERNGERPLLPIVRLAIQRTKGKILDELPARDDVDALVEKETNEVCRGALLQQLDANPKSEADESERGNALLTRGKAGQGLNRPDENNRKDTRAPEVTSTGSPGMCGFANEVTVLQMSRGSEICEGAVSTRLSAKRREAREPAPKEIQFSKASMSGLIQVSTEPTTGVACKNDIAPQDAQATMDEHGGADDPSVQARGALPQMGDQQYARELPRC
ncbi:hypothetical protein KFL_003310190, partial [Klebsormidium nitens]